VIETAGKELERQFAKVGLFRPAARNLRVTDADVIVDYALSIERAKPVLVGARLEEFRAAVREIIEKDGMFGITTAPGMFRASANG
jgi:hypothetical protein